MKTTITISLCLCLVTNTIGQTINNSKEILETIKIISEINDDRYDNFEIIERTKTYFNKYIVVRLKEIDEDGNASEYEESRQYYVGDINLDGIPDAIVLYTVEGVGGGNNSYRHILLLVNDGKKFSALNHAMVSGTLEGESKFIGIQNGYAVFDKMEFISYDLIERIKERKPSVYKKIGYGIRGDDIVIEEL